MKRGLSHSLDACGKTNFREEKLRSSVRGVLVGESVKRESIWNFTFELTEEDHQGDSRKHSSNIDSAGSSPGINAHWRVTEPRLNVGDE
jgi:hypothetical protein